MIARPFLTLLSVVGVLRCTVAVEAVGTAAGPTPHVAPRAASLDGLRQRTQRSQHADTAALLAAVQLVTPGWGPFRIRKERPCLNDKGVECRPSAADTLSLADRRALRQVLGPCPAADAESALIAVSRPVPVLNDLLVLVEITTRSATTDADRSIFGETLLAQYEATVHIADRGHGAATIAGTYIGDGPGGPLAHKHIPVDETCGTAGSAH